MPAPAALTAPPVNKGEFVVVDVALNLLDGRTREVPFRLADRMAEVVARLECVLVVARMEERVLVTWIRELGVDSTGVKAVTLDRGVEADGSAVRLVSRMRDTVSV